MRKMMLFALLVFATPLFASDPFTGTWKLNSAKSKYTTGHAPKAVTVVIEEQDTNLQVTATGTNFDGSPLSVKYSVPIEGGTATVQAGEGFDAITVKKVSDHVRENIYTKGGVEIIKRKMTVSEDGKTMQSVVNGTNSKGIKVEGVDVLDKQ